MSDIIGFLTNIVDRGCAYRTVLGHRSALNAIVSLPGCPDITQHPLIKRFVKGVFNLNPPTPRYAFTWDIRLVFNYLSSLGENHDLSFLQLSKKTAILLALLAGKRVDSVHSYSKAEGMMLCTALDCTFIPSRLLKHTSPNIPLKPITYRNFPQNPLLCPVTTVADFLICRSELNPPSTALFISSTKPHGAASKDTVARWIKDILSYSGVDTSIFKPHSCRSASSSAAKSAGLPIHTILKAGDWSNSQTFFKHYCRDIELAYSPNAQSAEDNDIDFGRSLLSLYS